MQSDLWEKFGACGIISGGVILLPASSARALIKEAEKSEIDVLGIDTFIVANGRITPVLEFSRSFCDGEQVNKKNHRLAVELINRHEDAHTYFEVVLGDE
jgi:hypothetical protein